MKPALILLAACIFTNTAPHAMGEGTLPDDPNGVLRKPIPDKLIVLTFDDACRSHATFVGPLLRKYGFGATFYITRFGNPALDPEKYMSWQEIKGLEDAGFEIGNHTWSHSQIGEGGEPENHLPDVTKIEDLFLANHLAKPTTFCWPIYTTSMGLSALLVEKGYLFGRSGGSNDRPYQPTVDHPFKTPSFTIMANTPLETFTAAARRATRGRISIYTFHGVPDIEHPGVGVEPALFGQMMRYLKDNQYTVIAMRDMAKYVDVKMAAKVLPIPAVASAIKISDTAGLVAGGSFSGSNVVCKVSAQAGRITFGGSGSGRVTVDGAIAGTPSLIHAAPYVLELVPRSGANALGGIDATGSTLVTNPGGLNGAPLNLRNATLKLQDALNTWKDFPSVVTLTGTNTIQSLDDHRAVMTGKMTGNGNVDYTGFYPIGRVNSDSDYTGNTRIAQDEWFGANPDDRQGHDDLMFGISGTKPFGTGVVTIAGKVGTRMGLAWFGQRSNAIPNAVVLETALVFNGRIGEGIDMAGNLSGPGSLVKVFEAKDNGSNLRLRGENTYSGGTRFFSGNLWIYQNHSLGTGPVTLGGKAADPKHVVCLRNQAALVVANAIELAGITDATVDSTCPTFSGNRGDAVNNPGALTEIHTGGSDLTLTGAITGSGGLLKTGGNTLSLAGNNRYGGPTTVTQGTLALGTRNSLGSNSEVSLADGAMLNLSFSGKMKVRKLSLGGTAQPAGNYDSANAPKFIKGPGAISVSM